METKNYKYMQNYHKEMTNNYNKMQNNLKGVEG